MQEALAEVEPGAARAQHTVGSAPGKKRKSRKKPWYLRLVPASLIKFHNAQKKKRGKAGVVTPIIQKPQEGYENLEAPCGLGSIVIPSCQRFNNIHYFLIFYCTLVFSQGEPEGVGWWWCSSDEGSRGPSQWLPRWGRPGRDQAAQFEAAVLSNILRLNGLPSWVWAPVIALIYQAPD